MFCSGAESSSTSAEIRGSMEPLSSTPTTRTYYSTTTSGGTTFSAESTSDGANVFFKNCLTGLNKYLFLDKSLKYYLHFGNASSGHAVFFTHFIQ